MIYELPTSLVVGGIRHEIRSDYRAVLDILAALSDHELSDADKLNILLNIFYIEVPENIEDAVKQCFLFINRFQPENDSPQPKLMDWDKDFNFIADAITVKTGHDIRAAEYIHWWTFVGYYMNIGDCFFAQVVSVRKKRAKGQKLDDLDREFYRNNRALIDIDEQITPEEDALIAAWAGGENNGRRYDNY